MKKFISRWLILVLSALCPYFIFAQPADCVPSTSGENATIIFGQDASLMLDGAPLPIGTIIVSVFSTGNDFKCAGYTTWEGQASAISATGASGGFEGFSQGEIYKFRLELPGGDIVPENRVTVVFKEPDGLLCSSGNAFVSDGISCVESLSAMSQAPPNLTVSPLIVNLPANAGNTGINLISNSNWTAGENANWFSLAPQSGSGNSNVLIAYAQNTSTQSRSDVITFSVSGVPDQVVTVNQNGAMPVLELSADTLNFDYQANNQNVQVTSNTNWTATKSDSWFTINSSTGSGNNTVAVSCSENMTLNNRSGTLRFSTAGLPDRIIVINQKGRTSSTGQVDIDNHFKIFPNPASEVLNIEFDTPEIVNFEKLELVNSLGIRVYEKNLFSGQNEKFQIQVDALPNGFYWAILLGQNKIYRREFYKISN
ncbi:MAG TPA: BACON domain-containing carbohydrate-binding protein [Saprospiraceae bacterium]|nr:BACON domain-containing carbohydrate-binding protein [Saprospiraceae bacterium]